MRTLTLEDRRKIELMWRRNASPVKIAAELEISQCTVYTELKRGQETDGGGGEEIKPSASCISHHSGLFRSALCGQSCPSQSSAWHPSQNVR